MKLKYSVFFFLFFILFSCSSHYNIKESMDINAYKYVFIPPLSSDPYNVTDEFQRLFQEEGFEVIRDYTLRQLQTEERCKVLQASISYNSTSVQTDLNLSLKDSCRGITIYTGAGSYGMGWDMRGDVKGAARKAIAGLKSNFTGYSDSAYKEMINEQKSSYAKLETLDYGKDELVEYYDKNLSNLDYIEGVWSAEDGKYKFGILRDNDNSEREFVAIILYSENPLWEEKQVKMEIETTAHTNLYTMTYYTGNHSRQNTTATINEYGLLTIRFRDSNNKLIEKVYIKNYPKNINSNYSSPYPADVKQTISSGSGFLISKDGIVVTNYHVVEKPINLKIIFPGSQNTHKAKVLLKDTHNDIALLKITGFNYGNIYSSEFPFTVLPSKNVKLGQRVLTLGYPMTQLLGENIKFSSGNISSLYGPMDDPRLFQISNPIQPGNSGGPLFTEGGQVIGIVVSTLNSRLFLDKMDIVPQNVNFAIKSDYLINLVSMLPNSEDIINRNSALVKSGNQDYVQSMKAYVVQVTNEN